METLLFCCVASLRLEKRVNKKVMAMFEKAEDEYNDLMSKKNIIEVIFNLFQHFLPCLAQLLNLFLFCLE